jgi:hypothetical protein
MIHIEFTKYLDVLDRETAVIRTPPANTNPDLHVTGNVRDSEWTLVVETSEGILLIPVDRYIEVESAFVQTSESYINEGEEDEDEDEG